MMSEYVYGFHWTEEPCVRPKSTRAEIRYVRI